MLNVYHKAFEHKNIKVYWNISSPHIVGSVVCTGSQFVLLPIEFVYLFGNANVFCYFIEAQWWVHSSVAYEMGTFLLLCCSGQSCHKTVSMILVIYIAEWTLQKWISDWLPRGTPRRPHLLLYQASVSSNI